jgi:hypothetical protein
VHRNAAKTEMTTHNSNSSRSPSPAKEPLTGYALIAVKHWRDFLPRMVEQLELNGTLHDLLASAGEQTNKELGEIPQQLIQQGLTPQQAHERAWEMVWERYIFLPAED